MDTEITGDASTETEVDENTNANLSIEDLANSFVDQVESDNEDNSTTEAAEEPTDSEDADAEVEESEVLSQQSSDDTDDESDEDESDDSFDEQPKGLKRALKQISRLTARAKSSEELVSELKDEIKTLKSQPQENTEQRPDLENIQNFKDLEELRKQAMAAKMFALENINEDYAEMGGREYSREDINSMLVEAEKYLGDKIPQRAQYLQQKQAWQADTEKVFPYVNEGSGKDYEGYIQIRQSPEYKAILDSLPQGDFIAGLVHEGMKVVQARQKPKPKAKAKSTPPPNTTDDVAPPIESKQARQQKNKEAALGNGNVSMDQFAQFLQT